MGGCVNRRVPATEVDFADGLSFLESLGARETLVAEAFDEIGGVKTPVEGWAV